jgi:phage baseplate assembly protein V
MSARSAAVTLLIGRGASGVVGGEMDDGDRRHADHIKFGVVHDVDYPNAKVRVLIGEEDDPEGHLVTGWLPMAGARAGGDSEWHPLETGERVMVLSESGEVQNGMVMPAGLYCADNPPPGDKAGLWRKRFKNGAEISYDRDSGAMQLDATSTGTLTLKAGGCLIVLADGVITIKAREIVTDGRTRLNKGTRGVVFRGSRDSGGDSNIEGASDVYV